MLGNNFIYFKIIFPLSLCNNAPYSRIEGLEMLQIATREHIWILEISNFVLISTYVMISKYYNVVENTPTGSLEHLNSSKDFKRLLHYDGCCENVFERNSFDLPYSNQNYLLSS